MASTKTANRARLDALVGLVAKLDEYIAVLGDELNDTATIAVFHGWTSTRFDQGKKMRREIAALRRKANAKAETSARSDDSSPAPCSVWPCPTCGAVNMDDAGNKCLADWVCAADDQRQIDYEREQSTPNAGSEGQT